MPKRLKLAFITLMIPFLFLLSGCWDSVEINKRAFALGIAVDKGEEKEGDIQTTYEIALPGKIAKPSGGEGGGGEEGSATWDITKESRLNIISNHTMHENIDRFIDLEHMQLLLLGSEVSKDGVYDDVDFFFRRPQMRRRTKVVYTEGQAKDVLKVEPKTTKSPASFIADILTNNSKYSQTVSRGTDLGEMVQNIRDGFDFAIPRVKVINKQVIVDGAAAFKAPYYTFVSNIDEGEIEPMEWTLGRVSRATVGIPDPQKPEFFTAYEVSGGKGELKPVFSGDRVNFEIKLSVEGDIASMEDTNFLGTLEMPYIDAYEKAVENEMKAEIQEVFNKYEKQLMVDVLQLKRKIKNYNIKYYDKNKERLTEIIAGSNLSIKVDAKIRRVGLTK